MAGIEAMWNARAVLAVRGAVLEETLLIGGKQVVTKTLSKKEYQKVLDQALKEKVNGYKIITSESGSKKNILSSEEAEEMAFNAIKGSDKADAIVLGKYGDGGPIAYTNVAKSMDA